MLQNDIKSDGLNKFYLLKLLLNKQNKNGSSTMSCYSYFPPHPHISVPKSFYQGQCVHTFWVSFPQWTCSSPHKTPMLTNGPLGCNIRMSPNIRIRYCEVRAPEDRSPSGAGRLSTHRCRLLWSLCSLKTSLTPRFCDYQVFDVTIDLCRPVMMRYHLPWIERSTGSLDVYVTRKPW